MKFKIRTFIIFMLAAIGMLISDNAWNKFDNMIRKTIKEAKETGC